MKDELRHIADVDLVIERQGTTVTKILKSGVVIWPQERHTAPMLKDKPQTSSAPNEYMVGGDHYKHSDAVGKCPHCRGVIEHWDWAQNLRALEYAITKYTARWRTKGGLESLKKVIHYTQKLIEIHFPDVVVSINYSNRIPGTVGQYDVQELGRGKAPGSEEMARQQTAYSTALERGDQY